MPIQNMPASLQAAIQTGFLEREFHTGLQSAIGYRAIADREPVAINVGETVTKTRAGLKAPVATPLVGVSLTSTMESVMGITDVPVTHFQVALPSGTSVGMHSVAIHVEDLHGNRGVANVQVAVP